MKVKNIDISLKIKVDGIIKEFRFKETLHTRFNLLTGDSAIGKTAFDDYLTDFITNTDQFFVDYNSNRIVTVHTLAELFGSIRFKPNILFLDNSASTSVNRILSNTNSPNHNDVKDIVLNSDLTFIFTCRAMNTLSIDYRSVYTFKTYNDIIKSERLYADHLVFKNSQHYTIEDETTGLEYYRHYFKNVDTSRGKEKLYLASLPGDTVIGDGSAIGSEYELFNRNDINLYLSESFEYDLAKAWQPHDPLVTNYYEQMPDTINSVEQYFENIVLPELCKKHNIPKYKKSKKLNTILLNTIIHKSVKQKLQDYYSSMDLDYNKQVEIDSYLVTDTICANHNISVSDIDARAYLALQMKGEL